MSVPLGSWPGGYHLETFSERFTNNGAEATMVFIGPSAFRWTLIGDFFPRWAYVISAPGDPVCCASYIAGSGPLSYGRYFLWPDTFSVEPFDSTCTPDLAAGADPGLRLMKDTLYTDGADGDCAARVTINFRSKHHATWPRWMLPCNGEEDMWVPPTIPTGTFIEVSMNPNIDGWTPTGDTFEAQPDTVWARNNLQTPLHCDTVSAGTPAGADGCTTEITFEAQSSDTQLVFAQEMEVRWSGVPIVDMKFLRSLEGTTNRTVWMGYPPEGVRLSTFDIEEQCYFNREADFVPAELFTVVLKFDIKTANVWISDSATIDEIDQAHRGVYNGRVGLWNRAWSNTPMWIGGSTGDRDICTNWIPIRIKPPATPEGEQPCCDVTRVPHPLVCFDDIFTIPACS